MFTCNNEIFNNEEYYTFLKKVDTTKGRTNTHHILPSSQSLYPLSFGQNQIIPVDKQILQKKDVPYYLHTESYHKLYQNKMPHEVLQLIINIGIQKKFFEKKEQIYPLKDLDEFRKIKKFYIEDVFYEIPIEIKEYLIEIINNENIKPRYKNTISKKVYSILAKSTNPLEGQIEKVINSVEAILQTVA